MLATSCQRTLSRPPHLDRDTRCGVGPRIDAFPDDVPDICMERTRRKNKVSRESGRCGQARVVEALKATSRELLNVT